MPTTITVVTANGEIHLTADEAKRDDDGLQVLSGGQEVAWYRTGAFLGYHLSEPDRAITETGGQ